MGRIVKSLGVTVLSIFCVLSMYGQAWTDKSKVNTKSEFDEIVENFDSYWSGKAQSKGNGFKPFKRWQYRWQHRVDQKGEFPKAGQKFEAFEKFTKTNHTERRSNNSSWISSGPNLTGSGYEGRGRINSVAFHPTNDDIIYVGSAGGGLWKTIDGGDSWAPKTDLIGSLGVSAILIDPINPQIIYIGTGDGDASDNYSIGVLKSLDGGDTWNTTGLDWATSNKDLIRRMVFDVDDNSTIVVATSIGIYRSTDSGAAFTQEQSGNFYDVEVNHNASSNGMYASTNNEVYRSTNNGNSWSVIHTIPNSGRLAIATTPADNNYLYILSSGNSNGANGSSGFNGLYRSTNSGTNITLQSDSPNLLNGNSAGSGTGGQGWYDLAFTAHPTDKNTIHVAGVNHWKSVNGGSTWQLKSHWFGGGGVQAVHADKHVLQFQDDNTLWEGNDGGIYVTSNGGDFWTDKSGDLVISQMYRLSVSETNNQALAGLQDNGTLLLENNGTWDHVIGGDGMDCAIHPTVGSTMYGEYQNGNISRSTNGGISWSGISNNIPGQPEGAWVTPFILDPTDENVIIAGYQDVFKSTNKGNTWSALGPETGSSDKQNLIMSPLDNNYLFVGTYETFWSSSNGGISWKQISSPSSGIGMIAASPANVHTIYAVKSGFNDGEKVYKSTDGGNSWFNISTNLPNIPCHAVAVHNDGKETVYVGMDIGVYYKNEDEEDWTLYNDDLPNVEVRDIEIKEASNEIHIATYGRGLWNNETIGNNTACGIPKNLNISEVVANSTTATWDDPSNTPSSGFEWLLSQSQRPMGTGTSTFSNSALLLDLLDGEEYFIHVRSNCEGVYSSWSTYGPFGTFAPDHVCGDSNFDTGGTNGNYSNLEDEVWVICPEEGTSYSTITFNSFSAESSYDALYIHDGIDITSPLFPGGVNSMSNSFPIGGFNGSSIPGPFTSTNAEGCITLRFRSDFSVTQSGWDIDVSCTELCESMVTSTADNGAGTLRDIIECSTNGNTITFDPAMNGQTISLDTPIEISSNIRIEALISDDITIDVDNKGPVFDINAEGYLQLQNLTIFGGRNLDGSAILNNGALKLDNVTLNGNVANPDPNSILLNNGLLILNGDLEIKE